MFKCMIPECTARFESVYIYFEHISDIHRVPRVYRYVCTYVDCSQKLSNWYVFKRHVLGHVEGFSQGLFPNDQIDYAQAGPSIEANKYNCQESVSTIAEKK